MPKLFVATTSMVADGTQITEGDTIQEGHPLMLGREKFFRPFRPTFTHQEPPKRVGVAPASPAPKAPATRPKPQG